MKRSECTLENLMAVGLKPVFEITNHELEGYLARIRKGEFKVAKEPYDKTTYREVPDYMGCYTEDGDVNLTEWSHYPRYTTEVTHYECMCIYGKDNERVVLMKRPTHTTYYKSRIQMYMGD